MASRRPKPMLSDDPLWYKDAVIYQIHVKSFFDANNDGVGDFAGLTAKLDYIADLGVDAIWLLPFYPSPRLDDGYDIAEYRAVHPDYGSLADVRRFIAAAHARGLRVITELVINHTSDQHPWFQRARHAKPGSPARNYYVWSDTDQRYADTRIIFCDTEPSNWTWDPVAGQFYWHRFYSHQPDLNFDNPQVLREVIGVMRFWLDLGVDGLRLDAVPYLIEREGTNCENLPETHAILKKLRAALDARYHGRMLLAEANQWPEDVQEYFGGAPEVGGTPSHGDECHMAFHFPLMPRMYMAIAQEDRFPITDIMRQTPDIPANCQWAIFLRNHDELTLEMVTDRERDYLWETYATDRRARLNLGIRRRLAPLLERDRRRIELMNSLLLSMPGTPVIYYGDEIGMGDNIHLGDRDGVRTPMQWSPDRNGGFSRADPEQLVLPPIMGTLYGFETVNVEAQARDPHSLLNWMRRLLAIRRQHCAFGRGTIRFLSPANRKILAYLREYNEEVLLCVANLAHTPQAVELDLAEFGSRIPVELTGNSPFPPVGQLTYLLTLPPFGFYWFQLRSETQLQPSWHKPAPEPMPEYATLVLRRGLDEVLAPAHQKTLLREALPAYLPKRRWFAQQDGAPPRPQIGAVAHLHSQWQGKPQDILLAEIQTEGREGEHYLLPLAIAWEDEVLRPLPQQLALARVRRGRRVGYLTDAFSLEMLPFALFRALRERRHVPLADGGELRFVAEPAVDLIELPDDAPVRWIAAEQSNSSVLIDETLIVKLVRRVRPGVHPQTEMARYLARMGFANTPPLLGELVRVDAQGRPHTYAIVERYIRNEGDAWSWTLTYLNRTFDELALAKVDAEQMREAYVGYAQFIGTLGRRLGELHTALSAPSDDDAFAPQPVTQTDLRAWATEVRAELEHAFDLLRGHTHWSSDALREDAAELLALRETLADGVERVAAKGADSLRTRVHGDFHLGQVLVSQNDAWLIDFEGEPSRPLDARRMLSSPLRDVAGLLRSLHYAAHASAAGALEAAAPSAQERGQTLMRLFLEESERAFLAGYREVAAQAPHPWASREAADALTTLFMIGKAAYEVAYELQYRPAWVGLPVQGLLDIAERLSQRRDQRESADVLA